MKTNGSMKAGKTIFLKDPFMYKPFGNFLFSLELKKLTLRPIKAGDLIGLDFMGNNAHESSMILISRISGVDVEAIKQLDSEDYEAAMSEIGKIFQGAK